MILGIPVEFFLFVGVLGGVALLHHHTLQVALTGLAVIVAYKLAFTDFHLAHHLAHESVTLLNLFGLLLGFALLADHFEESKLPDLLPTYLPDGRAGAFSLLVLVAVLSSILDNIAAAMIGASIASRVFQGRVHVGYLAAIVAASNAGGAGSVVGDTTTTMMWIAGKSPLSVLHAYIGSVAAVAVIGFFASGQQDKHQRILADPTAPVDVDGGRLGVVALILALGIGTNITGNLYFPEIAERVPALGLAVWAGILLGAPFRHTAWRLLPEAAKGAVFLLSLVLCASMMPVADLPAASWPTALGLGFVSSVFDNIPLTALALRQGGYDWGVLAFCVGYGGSMVWFGSSAGVAVAGRFPEARSVGAWVRGGWHVALGYVVGFLVLMLLWGWKPEG